MTEKQEKHKHRPADTAYEASLSEAETDAEADADAEFDQPVDHIKQALDAFREGNDPTLFLAPEFLVAMVSLELTDLPEYSRVLALIKEHGCNMSLFHKGSKRAAKDNAAILDDDPDVAKAIASEFENGTLYCNDDGLPFMDITIDEKQETYEIGDTGSLDYLTVRIAAVGDAPKREEVKRVASYLAALARRSNIKHQVFRRVAVDDEGNRYIDLCNTAREVIVLTLKGWRVTAEYPVRFYRPQGMGELPAPTRGGSIHDIWKVLPNVSETAKAQVLSFVLGGAIYASVYAGLAATGPKGSAKTTTCSIIRQFIDPVTNPEKRAARFMQNKVDDLVVAASSRHVIFLDNVSRVPNDTADALCIVMTSGVLEKRALYADKGLIEIAVSNPVLMTGIGSYASRSDLIDRLIFLTLTKIEQHQRRTLKETWALVRELTPSILGGICDAIVTGLQRQDKVVIDEHPRLADTYAWAIACEASFYPEGTMKQAWAEREAENQELDHQQDLFAMALGSFMRTTETWTGSLDELGSELVGPLLDLGSHELAAKIKNPRTVNNSLVRAHDSLAGVGITYAKTGRGTTGPQRNKALYTITNSDPDRGNQAPTQGGGASPSQLGGGGLMNTPAQFQ